MGREVRRVPADWVHPKRPCGDDYQPLYDKSFREEWDEFENHWKKWQEGFRQNCEVARDNAWISHGQDRGIVAFVEWHGHPPDPDYYRPDWPPESRTHYQMYETTTEGTPISPVMESPEAVARWLADNGASAFGSMTATYDEWLRVCRGGYATSAVMTDGVLTSGVSGL